MTETTSGVLPDAGDTASQLPAEDAEAVKVTGDPVLDRITKFCGAAGPRLFEVLKVS